MPSPIPVSAADRAWLRMEHPANPMTISGVLLTKSRMDRATLLSLIEERLTIYPRFQMRIDDASARSPSWVPEDPFDAERRVIPLVLPEPGDQRALEKAVSGLMSTPLSFDEPPWTFHLVENYGEGSAIVVRIHHVIADGIALMHVLLSMSDELFDPRLATGEAHPEAAKTSARNPNRKRSVWSGTKSLGHLLTMSPDAKTALKGESTAQKHAAWSRAIPLGVIKRIGAETGAKVNDVLTAAASGALRRYLMRHSDVPDRAVVRAAMPVNVRPLDKAHELGNAFSLVFLPLAVGEDEPTERLRAVKTSMDRIKATSEAEVAYLILQTMGGAPRWVHRQILALFEKKASAVMTNVPGPQQELHLYGVPIGSLMFWVPQAGRIGLGLSMLSYDGNVYVGVAADANRIANPWELVEAFEAEFDALATRYAS